MQSSVDDIAERLATVPLFAHLDPDDRRKIAERVTEAEFPAGQHIVRQGEIGSGLFILLEGSAEVVRDGKPIAELGPGEFLGELSALDRQPRVAAVVAKTPTRCLALAAWDLEDLVRTDGDIAIAMLRGLARRMRAVLGDHHSH
jgi:CRP/FNR family cyclic AMP-dependent transcriptional regulator